MAERADIVIVGGAIVGSAVAYFLKRLGFEGRVLVIEKDPTYARASTTLAVGGIRQQFSTVENIKLSQFGLSFFRGIRQEFGHDADVGFKEQGYLLLASEKGRDVLSANAGLQRRHGADTLYCDRHAVKWRFPWLSVDGIAAGTFGRTGEGWFDPWSLMSLMRRGAASHGVQWRTGEVVGVVRSGPLVDAVELADGDRIYCGVLVNAAGASGGAVARLAAIPLPVGPVKRYVYVIDCREADESLHRAPMTIDHTGVYFRPESGQFLCGLAPELEDEPTEMDFEVDYRWFEERVWPLLAHRVPAFEAVKVVNGWAGHYDYNFLDHNAVLGPHPVCSNFYFANGFSGHGAMHAAGAGHALAEHILFGGFRTIDLGRFGYGRIAARRPLREVNVF